MFPTDLLQTSKNREPGEGWLRVPAEPGGSGCFAQELQRRISVFLFLNAFSPFLYNVDHENMH